ncbi:RsmF rRNA methyltransferase first C-terminal domain-containing protein [Niabella yanshanensis]|uniref:RsmF rRNA methyltransferase first C-terminal domain-containing protein n=1 Tax=Niabella yanshanensis TaxID=577386 RepID=A0ABZ0W9A4_9BACT|nr:RsmF rRNA methyltransferase first C-terminal domain-containing protein [Niabella yanshanensis]WQD39863.1 RsmF rRNA methyltransferase first C-terminal domain-containing protein [Niabella yanshanensis]
MQLPSALIQSLQGLPGFNEQQFVDIHNADIPVTSIRLNPAKPEVVLQSFNDRDINCMPIPWTSNGYYLSERPSFTFDPLFHAGTYYVQEASSMFLEQALQQSVDVSNPLRVLDLCAAPGGKSTHLQSLLSPGSLLVSNEVIRQRVNILKDNIVKWGSSSVVVTNNDPKDFSKLKGYFDVILVDAPCSGSGLFRRDEEAIDEWSENNVVLCSQRQQRILADVLPALKEGGVLIYSTCSYSQQEDEDIADWLTSEFALSNISFKIQDDWHITEAVTSSGNRGYRFWPHLAKGEGFFLAAFQLHEGDIYKNKNRHAIKAATKQLSPLVAAWANPDNNELIQVNDKIYAWPAALFGDFDLILQHLRIIYSGTLLGELAHKKLIPDHALAMSRMVGEAIGRTELQLSESISYLQKNTIENTGWTSGWQLATYNNHALGWMNVLPNRINNYYPKELRILKQKINN